MEPVLFARIGWMTYYAGPQPGDLKPERGGEFNLTDTGNEAFNFASIGGKLFGYFQPQKQADSIQLKRIQPTCASDSLGGVTVVFVATQPEGGQRIVGWYQNATVFHNSQPDKSGQRGGYDYYITANVDDAVLLPTWNRTQPIPGKKGGFGRANVRYLYEDGKAQQLKWADEAIDFVHSYQGGNLLTDPTLESASEIQIVLEKALGKAAGYEVDSKIRAAVESRAMDVVEKHFRKLGYTVSDVHKTKSYDFCCTLAQKTLYVEVKGTRGVGETIALTGNEVKFARKNNANMMLCVVHSISVTGTKKPKATGGQLICYKPWNPDQHQLREVAYTCTLEAAMATNA